MPRRPGAEPAKRREDFLPFNPPSIGEEEIAEVVDTLRSGWITTGPKVAAFEAAFAQRVGAPAALGLSSCTAAMHVALAALGVGPGDVVVTTPMTFCSTVHVVEHLGARPLFVDVEPATLTMDARQLSDALSRKGHQDGRLKAILPVHFAGHPCDLDAILAVASDFGMAVVEDAAHALPARWKGRPIGEVAAEEHHRAVAFSFYATKNLTTGEGGMLTATSALLEEARMWSLHGMSRDAWERYQRGGSWYYEVVRPGFKYNMTDIEAAIGLRQLEKLDGFQARRRQIAARYTQAFTQVDEVEAPSCRPEADHAWHLYVLRLHLDRIAISRAQFIDELSSRRIGTSVHFIPVHVHPYYRDKYGHRPDDFPVTLEAYQRAVSLPIYPAMTDQDVDDVVEAVVDVVQRWRA
jgi:dTDP-4-amino-4,6-dideoxygalactose transaminase